MPEILTESFCERCGTRYTFESAAPRAARLKGMRVLSRGLKNFVLSDDSSLDEAMAAARSDTEREVTTQQLDAFHKTFNFCMQCRQYTCANCWNDVEGRCLTCAPHLGHDILAAPFPDLEAGSAIDLRVAPNGNGSNGHDHAHGHDTSLDSLAWPTVDAIGEAEPAVESVVAADDEPAAMADTSPIDAAPTVEAIVPQDPAEDIEPEAVSAPTPSVQPDPAAADPEVADRAAAAAAATAQLLQDFRPGQSLDDALDAYERDQAAATMPAVEIDAAPDPAAAASVEALAPTVETSPEAAPEAQAVETSPEAAPEAQATPEARPEPEIAAPVEAAPPAPVAPPADRVEQPTWRIVAPDQAETGSVSDPSSAPATRPTAPTSEPQWPSKPEWPTPGASAGLPFLGRPATPTGGMEALWAESAKEVSTVPTSGPASGGIDPKAAGGVQPCISCGLSLSANARFCRRCGSRQG